MNDSRQSDTDNDLIAYPRWVREQEDRVIGERRRIAELTVPQAVIGLALSGGGIRSATFSLGLLQALARHGFLRRIDYLSTVSGGGFIGSFLGGLYLRRPKVNNASPSVVSQVEEDLARYPEAFPVRWLRENGRYLAPTGVSASWLGAGIALRNWASLLVVMLLGGAAAALLVELLHGALWEILVRAIPATCSNPFTRNAHLDVLVVVPSIALVYGSLPSALAYWLVPVRRSQDTIFGARATAVALASVGVALGLVATVGLYRALQTLFLAPAPDVASIVRVCGWTSRMVEHSNPSAWQMHVSAIYALLVAPILIVAALMWGAVRGWRLDDDSRCRHRLSSFMTGSLMLTSLTGFIVFTDSIGEWMSTFLRQMESNSEVGELTFQRIIATTTSLGAVVVAAHRTLAQLTPKGPSTRIRLPLRLTMFVVATAVVMFMLSFVFACAHTIVWTHSSNTLAPTEVSRWLFEWPKEIKVLLVFIALVLLVGRFIAFVNQSSLYSFYASKLTRTYLGASNLARRSASEQPATHRDLRSLLSIAEPILDDAIRFIDYTPHAQGGPLHLINVTINETVDPRAQVAQPDRRGVPMAISPLAVSVGIHHHIAVDASLGDRSRGTPMNLMLSGGAATSQRFRVFPTKQTIHAERLDVGEWIGVSG
ncbi:MAG: patatin-like phospholipase family protein, partial [Polyangiales bacterium]